MKRDPREAAIKSSLSACFERFYREGASPELELTWLDLRNEILKLAANSARKLSPTWHGFGYLILDGRKNFGGALSQLVDLSTRWDSSSHERFLNWRSIFNYSAFVADDKYVSLLALEHLVSSMSAASKPELQSVRLLILNYVLNFPECLVSKATESLMRQVFGFEAMATTEKYLTGSELAEILDPSKKLLKILQKKGSTSSRAPRRQRSPVR